MCGTQAIQAAGAEDEFFENRIRPVLSANCAACHGTAALSGLRMDSREHLLKGGLRGPAIVPGDPDKSLLIQAVRYEGDIKMPQGNKLKPAEIADLTEWIRKGAVWPETQGAQGSSGTPDGGIPAERRKFWSFQPLKMPSVPSVKNARWPKNDIDRFILSRLELESMRPVAPADRRTLIRRVYYDLIGLPPTPEQVEAFVKDASPQAYSVIIDELLASPRYGEKWGRHWLDVARFGEDDMRGLARRGYEPYENAYLYRDWVIRAFNEDMPFDTFLKAQLAADQFEEDSRVKMLPALGFLGQGPWYYDTNEPPIARADERHERVDTITRSMLGLTVGCARCHDHKYDPITAKDYHAIAGIVGNTVYHEYPLVPSATAKAWTEEDKKIKALQKALDEFSRNAAEELAEILALQTERYMVAAWNVTGAPQKPLAEAAAEAKLDQEVLERWTGFLAKPPTYYPYLKKWQALIAKGGTVKEAQELGKEFQTLLFEVLIEKREMDEKNRKIIAKGTPLEPKPSVILPNSFKSFFDRPQLDLDNLPVDRLNLWTDVFQRDLSSPEGADPSRARPGLLVFRGYSLERQLGPQSSRHMETLRKEVDARRKASPQFPFVHGVIDVEKPEDLKVHLRGSPYDLGEPVPRRFLEVLSKEEKAYTKGSGRLELGESIVKSPLAARVIVNRVWKWHFGTGIVDTPSNFGQTGERPSHPELLDYLASVFVEGGWSIKKLHRSILLSSAYQLSDAVDEGNLSKDVKNRFYWRSNRRRMDAQEIRDSLLSIAGVLDETPGGPSFDLDSGKSNRRTVYGRVSRFKLDTYLQVFDFPNPTISSEGRTSTNVPLQRLYFLNSDFVNQQAALLAKRIAAEVNDEQKIRKAYLLVYQRNVLPEELQAGLAFLKKERENRPGTEPASQPAPVSNTSLSVAAKPEAEPAKPAMDLAAAKRGLGAKSAPDVWALYTRVLLSSNEFLYLN